MMTLHTENEVVYKVPTNRGLTPINYLYPGDEVYSYDGKEKFEVKSIKKLYGNIIDIIYSDGRSQKCCEDSLIFTGNKIEKVSNIFRAQDRSIYYNSNINQYEIDFSSGVISEALSPDPYMAGMFFMYGDFVDPYLNLVKPRKRPNIFNIEDHLFHRYHLTPVDDLSTSKRYFSIYDDKKLVRWYDLFHTWPVFNKTSRVHKSLIPTAYSISSINDRWQFLRGAADYGYPGGDALYIPNQDETKLKELQKMMWSIGILSKISYNSIIADGDSFVLGNGMNYVLEILPTHESYPGMFYNIFHIKNFLNYDNHPFKPDNKFILSISRMFHSGTGYIYELILNKPNQIYLSENYLPRVSL